MTFINELSVAIYIVQIVCKYFTTIIIQWFKGNLREGRSNDMIKKVKPFKVIEIKETSIPLVIFQFNSSRPIIFHKMFYGIKFYAVWN